MKNQEKELFFELCKLDMANREKLLSLIQQKHATPRLLGELFYNRTAGIAYKTLSQHDCLNNLNREFSASLRCASEQNTAKNQSYFKSLDIIGKLLAPADKTYVMLKGAYLCHFYPEGCRTSNDIDILTTGDSVSKISERLLADGFLQGKIVGQKFVGASRREIVESKMTRGECVPFIKQVDFPFMKFIEVDINFSLDFKNGDTDVLRTMINSSRIYKSNDYSVPILSGKDFFIHLCAHLYKEATTLPWVKMNRDMTFYKYCDIFLILNRLRHGEAMEIAERARALGLSYECYLVIKQTKELFSFHSAVTKTLLDGLDAPPHGFMTLVISPKERKTYKYTEDNLRTRFFSDERVNMLEEAGEWIN